MPAVAIRRERTKIKQEIRPPTRRWRFVEYYHKKISRMESLRPTGRSYSTSTTLDNDLPPELIVEVDPYDGRCPALQRILGYVSLFHAGCILIGSGLVVLFFSMSNIKADVLTMRAMGSFLVALGALLCLLRTIFFKKPQTHKHVLRLRSSDSFGQMTGMHSSPGVSPGMTMEVIHEVTSDEQTTTSPESNNTQAPPYGLVVGSALNLPKSDSKSSERSQSPLRPNSADKMLPGRDEEKSL